MTCRRSADRLSTGPPDFTCSRHDAGEGTVRVVVSGELDLATSAALDDALSDALPRTILDLRGLTFIDCSSLSVLVSASERARAAGGGLRLVRGTTVVVDRLFSLTGIERRLGRAA
jgi:anti-anti-sigma factor